MVSTTPLKPPCLINSHDDPRLDLRRRAAALYFQCWSPTAISTELNVPLPTVYSWRHRDKWDEQPIIHRLNTAIDAKLQGLIALPVLGNGEKSDIDFLMKQVEKVARINKYVGGGNEVDLNPKLANRNDAPRKPKNELTDEDVEKLESMFFEDLFDYQKRWFEAGQVHRMRNILKSRQIGATFYFAREALIDALTTGRNQIFLSASKAQAHVFRSYICAFVREHTEKELKGEVIRLPNGAELYFLGTNTRTAQSYHGNVYMDEYFWIHGFTEFRKVASGMAMHKKWRQTYFSTPSALTHEAYDFWSASKHQAKHGTLDISHSALKNGSAGKDKQWRQIITVEDAIDGGCDLFDLDDLKQEYSESEYANLLMCQFMDDSTSEFPFSVLDKCRLDSWEYWTDFKPFSLRPLCDAPVAIGYDPSMGGDDAGVVVMALPTKTNNKFRLLERFALRSSPDEQVLFIRSLFKKYNVQFVGMDTTGCGAAVSLLLKPYFPKLKEFIYNPQVKYMLVTKAQELMNKGRFEFDCGDKDIVSAFTSVKRTVTASGSRITYDTDRRGKSHGDIAWACMHAFAWENLGGDEHQSKSVGVEAF